jgi:hypothetical protein
VRTHNDVFEVSDMSVRLATRGGIHSVIDHGIDIEHGWTRAVASMRPVRVERAWTAQVTIPLLMIATVLTGTWAAWPVLLFASWWWTPQWRWSWLVALLDGCFGAQWAFTGATSLAWFPSNFVTVATVWTVIPAGLAASGAWNRKRIGRREWQPPV